MLHQPFDFKFGPLRLSAEEVHLSPEDGEVIGAGVRRRLRDGRFGHRVAAIESVAPAVGPHTAVVPLLNGMRHLDALDARFGAERVLGGSCFISARLDDAGRVPHLSDNQRLAFGERSGGRSEQVDAVAAAMAGAKFEAAASKHVLLEMWEKWVFLASLAGVTCLTRAAVGDLVAAGGADLAAALLEECRSVAAAAAGYPPRPESLLAALGRLINPGSAVTASMLGDVERRGRTEADHVLGDLLRRRGGEKRRAPLAAPPLLHPRQGRGDRTLHPRYAALASHYTFAPRFCLPATPREKPRVENRVKDLERMWATPVPQVRDLGALNAHLRQCCQAARERTCGGNAETVQARFDRDRAAALPVPVHAFDPCVIHPASVDKYQTARFDGNAYSVPRRWAFRPATVKGYVDRVVVVADGQEIASHPRAYGRAERVLDPRHLLVVLEKKPAALDHAPVYRDWQLPAAFAELRRDLEARLGGRGGTRQFIRVLQLLARHPVERVEQAIRAARARGDPTAAAVATAADRRASDPGASPSLPAAALAVTVPRPDLSRFDHLLSNPPHGGEVHGRSECPAVEGQPEAVATADDAGRAREAGPGSGDPG